jgi:hypothetical protein
MDKPHFDESQRCYLKTTDGDSVILYKRTWDLKISYPERQFLEYNFDKLKETLLYPDCIKNSRVLNTAKIYYKHYERIFLRPNITGPRPFFLKVIVNKPKKGNRIITSFMPTDKVR